MGWPQANHRTTMARGPQSASPLPGPCPWTLCLVGLSPLGCGLCWGLMRAWERERGFTRVPHTSRPALEALERGVAEELRGSVDVSMVTGGPLLPPRTAREAAPAPHPCSGRAFSALGGTTLCFPRKRVCSPFFSTALITDMPRWDSNVFNAFRLILHPWEIEFVPFRDRK